MDLKRFQIPHRLLFWGFGADKTFTTRWSGWRVQVWVQVQAPACHLAITPEGYSRRQSKVLTAKSIAELLGPRSGTARAGQTGWHKNRAFPSRWQTGSHCRQRPARLRKTCYPGPLLRYWHSSRVKKVFMLGKFRADTSHFFFTWNEIFDEIGEMLLPTKAAPIASLNLFGSEPAVGLWVEIWHRNKSTFSESNSAQSSRSKSTTCPRKGRLLRFK